MGFLLKVKVIVPALIVLLVGFIVYFATREKLPTYTTFTVRQGPLDITVLEGGDIEALENQEVKSQVKGWQGVKILSIVDEGAFITEEDVANKKVLVELDSSELIEKLVTREIAFKGTQASMTEAIKGYDIQLNKSESDIYASELETKFANLEMEKYLGKEVTEIVVRAINLADASVEITEVTLGSPNEEPVDFPKPGLDTIETDPKLLEESSPAAEETPGKVQAPEIPSIEDLPDVTIEDLRLSHPDITFSDFVKKEMLGDGGANQELSNLTSQMKLAEADLVKAETDLEGKKKLRARDFITEQELRTSEILVEKQQASKEAAEKALQIFKNYEFPKQAEKLMSDFIQAKRKLERTEHQALSELAQAKAKMASARARHKIEEERIKEYQEQIEFCVMRAEIPGLVVYGGEGSRYWDEEPIKEGATIRERQAIITIPDMTSMAVKINVHESDIKKIKVGLPARVRLDGFPKEKLEGEVIKVAVLPNAQNRWMNPDLKVYETTIKIKGSHEWLKPGMSAETEVLLKRLDDAIYIPLQSVVPKGKDTVCYVIENGVPTERVIETGDVTIEFVTVTSGLVKGEEVLIRPPEGSRVDESEETEEEEESEEVVDANESEEADETDSDEAGKEKTEGEEKTEVIAPSETKSVEESAPEKVLTSETVEVVAEPSIDKEV
jgi:hypothetical protein